MVDTAQSPEDPQIPVQSPRWKPQVAGVGAEGQEELGRVKVEDQETPRAEGGRVAGLGLS